MFEDLNSVGPNGMLVASLDMLSRSAVCSAYEHANGEGNRQKLRIVIAVKQRRQDSVHTIAGISIPSSHE